jgi:rhamnopyranosyl-N-acetylglucosaminyl-diphospho-decaprenol beta-1,3/1,4-galactofuranosyltransferase
MAVVHGVLVTYQRPDEVKAYLEALATQTRRVDTLLVVDNDPAESARAIVEGYDLDGTAIDYLATGDNLGPAGGIALGMNHVLETAADDEWVALLDDDDPPRTPEMLETLQDFGSRLREEDPRVAGVGICGGRFDRSRGKIVHVEDHELSGPVPSCGVAGNQLPLFSVHAIRAVGVFDADLFFGFEEFEYGMRLADSGFLVYAHGDLWLRERTHHRRLNRRSRPDRRLGEVNWRRYYSLRNLVYIMRRHGSRQAALRLSLIGLGKPVYNVPRSPRLAWKHLQLNARAVADAYLGHMGRTVEPPAKW